VAPKKSAAPGPPRGRALALLSPLIHGRGRLLILSLLLRQPQSHFFTHLRDDLAFSDGALSVNLAKLEAAGLVRLTRSFVGRKPQTAVRITAKGKREFAKYVAELREIVPGLS